MSWPLFMQDNRFADALIAASSTAVGNFNAANVADLRNYTWYQPLTMPATLTVDCGSAKAADFFAIFAHNLGSLGCTAELRGSTDNFVASNVLVSTVTPANDLPFAILFGSVSYRYWQLHLTGPSAPTIAMVLAGAGLYMPKGVASGFDPIGREVVGSQNTNDNGNPLGLIIDSEGSTSTMNFRVLLSWLRATWIPAWKAGLRGAPALLAWDIGNYPSEIKLVRLGQKWATPHEQGAYAQLTFDVNGPAS